MKQFKEGFVIWLACSAYIMSATAFIIWASIVYGLVGITAFFIIAISILQLYKMVYEWFALHRAYNLGLVKTITNCWIIYKILDIALCTGWLFSSLFLMAENSLWRIPKPVYCIIIIILGILLTLKPIQTFARKERCLENKRYSASLINAYVPRFVILYTFVVYYFIAFIHFKSQNEIIPSLCVVYIAIERMISMFDTVKEYSKQEYFCLFKDTIRWMRK